MNLEIIFIIILVFVFYYYNNLSKSSTTTPLPTTTTTTSLSTTPLPTTTTTTSPTATSLSTTPLPTTTPQPPPGPQCPEKMISNGASLCYTPCDPGFTFDNDHLCKKEGTPVDMILYCLDPNDTVKPSTKLCTTTLTTPPQYTWGCPTSYFFNANYNGSGTCWSPNPASNGTRIPATPQCPVRWVYDGSKCTWASDYTPIKNCPTGYKFNDTATQCVPYFYTTNTQKLN